MHIRRPSDPSLADTLTAARAALPSYPEVGATRDEVLPDGYLHDRYSMTVGEGLGVFDRAASALFGWQPQIGAGIEVLPRGARVEDGATVVLLLRAGLWAPAPCRVVYVVDEPGQAGFAYGTLPGHPECGEVAFELSHDSAGRVAFDVRSFSRRVDPLARLGAPIARIVQKRVTARYLEALAKAANND
jgi:uncharacterized protein (UPF0548 family)